MPRVINGQTWFMSNSEPKEGKLDFGPVSVSLDPPGLNWQGGVVRLILIQALGL